MCVSKLRYEPSYKLMIQLGFTQLVGIQFAGLYTGLQTMWGTVFCSAPNFKYVFDGLISAHWVTTSTTCDILGINRVCALYSSDLTNRVFGGWKLYAWMAFPLVYGCVMFFFLPPLIYNSYMMAFFLNPHYGYYEVGVFGDDF